MLWVQKGTVLFNMLIFTLTFFSLQANSPFFLEWWMSPYIVEYPHTFVHLQGPEKNFHGIICPIDIFFLGFMIYSLSVIQTPCGILVNDIVSQVFTAVLTLLKKRDCLKLRILVIWQLLFRYLVSFSCPTLIVGGAELAQCYTKPLHHHLCRGAIENYCGKWCCTTAVAQDGENFFSRKIYCFWSKSDQASSNCSHSP